ncbi:MAG: PAS domain S-box protein, partial [Armatimonadetes bacterium]|nr:PAS domain S-box protein [Armatimonadota bacterium]
MISTTQKKTLAGFVLALILAGVLGTLARAGMLRPACLLAASELALLCGVWGLTRRDSLERGAQQARMEAADDDLTIANSRLEHASQRFAELYQALPIPCACSDTDGRIFEWNRAFEACFGLPAEQIFLRAVWEATGTPEQTPRIREIAARVSAGEAVTDWEQVCRLPDGTERHLLCSAHPLRDRDGRITGSISTYLDITERKRAEEARRAAEERYRDVFEDALEGIFQSTPDGRFLSVNPAMARMFGYDTPQEMVAAVTDIQRQFWVRPQD